MSEALKTQVVVIGGGPGGYTAAFHLHNLGIKDITIVEKFPVLGGVCLNVGCIPSKTLLHTVEVMREAEHLQAQGITFARPKIDIKKLRSHQQGVTQKLNAGLKSMAQQRGVHVIQGEAHFQSATSLQILHEGQTQTLTFEQAIIAVGSRIIRLPDLPDDPRILDSTTALQLDSIPKKMLVIGGGIIGMEMAQVYHGLGADVTIAELGPALMGGVDSDALKSFQKATQGQFSAVHLKTQVVDIKAEKKGISCQFKGEGAPTERQMFDAVLVAVGRKPNGDRLQLDAAGIACDGRGFIQVDAQMRTSVPHVFAIGDCIGQPMLAHKAVAEGKVAAEVIAGHRVQFAPACIPAVAYTQPEVAWVGLTEAQAKEQGIAYDRALFPWAASGRALAMGTEGMTKVLFDKESHRLLGAVIVGAGAGDLISEVALAIEMGCVAQDIALTIHPHPTLSETVAQACELYEGSCTDLYMPKKK